MLIVDGGDRFDEHRPLCPVHVFMFFFFSVLSFFFLLAFAFSFGFPAFLFCSFFLFSWFPGMDAGGLLYHKAAAGV